MNILHEISDETVYEMRRLWKDTFHDSDEYLSLIFDKLADLELCRCCVDETGTLVAALVGIPYTFCDANSGIDVSGCDSGNDFADMRALYLCGLCTKTAFRRRGIMHSLMSDIEQYAASAGFDFTFLIPADSSLRDYYLRCGYYTSCNNKIYDIVYRNYNKVCDVIDKINRKNCLYPDINSTSEGLNKYRIYDRNMSVDFITDSSSLYDNKIYDFIINKCIEFENEFRGMYIRHSRKEWDIILREKLSFGSYIILTHIVDAYDISHEFLGLIYEPDGTVRPLFGSLDLLPQVIETIVAEGKIGFGKISDSGDVRTITLIFPENYPDLSNEKSLQYFRPMTQIEKNIQFSRNMPKSEKSDEIREDLRFSRIKIVNRQIEKYGMVKILNQIERSKRELQIGFSFMLD